ncbi:MAG: glucose-1-phosphate thymidylyltransferase, partial [Zetaproteobacteria bacterium]
GDNLFFGHGLAMQLRRAAHAVETEGGGVVFAYRVRDPERYGVVWFDGEGRAVRIEEKPKQPDSSWAITGIYFFDPEVVNIAKGLAPSARGELEITDVNRAYLEKGRLRVERLGRGVAWLDTGTPEALLDAAHFVATLEQRQGLKIGCPEEVAWEMGYIDDEGLKRCIEALGKNGTYARYLARRLEEGR